MHLVAFTIEIIYTGFMRIYVHSIYRRVATLLSLYVLKVKLGRAADLNGVCGIKLLVTSDMVDRRQGNGGCWTWRTHKGIHT